MEIVVSRDEAGAMGAVLTTGKSPAPASLAGPEAVALWPAESNSVAMSEDEPAWRAGGTSVWRVVRVEAAAG